MSTDLTAFPSPAGAPFTTTTAAASAPTNHVSVDEDRPRSLNSATIDDRLCMAGSLAGSFALVWVLYNYMLPTSGKIGFVICWFLAFVATYCGVSSMSNPGPVVLDRFWQATVWAAGLLAFGAVLDTVGFLIVHGHAALFHTNFLTKGEAGVATGTAPLNQGGILNALVGSLIELALATIVSLPFGLGTAIYMSEVGGRFSRIVRTVVEAMTALPDLLAGLFILAFLILGTHSFTKGGFCAGMALAVTMLPIIARVAYVQLRVVPDGLREASLALGASRWRTTYNVVLPTARSGLATALILAMARAVGETAPVLIVSGASTFMQINPFHNQMNSLPLYIYSGVNSGQTLAIDRAYGAGLALLLLVMILFTLTRILARSKATR